MRKLVFSNLIKVNFGKYIHCLFILSLFNVVGQEVSSRTIKLDKSHSFILKKGITEDDVIEEVEKFLEDLKYKFETKSSSSATSVYKDTIVDITTGYFLWVIPTGQEEYDIDISHTLVFKEKINKNGTKDDRTEVEITSLATLDSKSNDSAKLIVEIQNIEKEVETGIKSIARDKKKEKEEEGKKKKEKAGGY